MAKKNRQADVRESARKIWLAGLGALSVAEEEGSKLFKTLVAQGEKYEGESREAFRNAKKSASQVTEKARKAAEETSERARKAAGEAWDQIGGAFDEKLTKALHKIGVPTRDEIGALSRRIEELTRAVDRVQRSKTAKPSGAARPKPAAKPAASKVEVKTTADVATTDDVVKG
jgi:poly(hydroxyalkanoate) granule-associated protein